MSKQDDGFTLVEIGISLAVSVLMLVILIGLFAMSRNQRFSDAISKTKDFVQRQYNDVVSGFNSRKGGYDYIGCEPDSSIEISGSSIDGGDATGNSRCYIIGRLIQFKENYMESYYIIVKPHRDDAFSCTNGVHGGTCYDDNNIWPFPNTSPRGSIEQASDYGWLYVVGKDSGGLYGDAGSKQQRELYGNNVVASNTYWTEQNRTVRRFNSNVKSVAIFRSPFDASITAYTNVYVGSDNILKLDKDSSVQNMIIKLESGGLPGMNSDAAICLSSNTLSSGIESASPVPQENKIWRICEGK